MDNKEHENNKNESVGSNFFDMTYEAIISALGVNNMLDKALAQKLSKDISELKKEFEKLAQERDALRIQNIKLTDRLLELTAKDK